MKKAIVLITTSLLSLPASASDAYGNPFEGSGFIKDDWHVVCDNTLTCRAVGYTDESAEWRGSILMTISAGEKVPNTEIILNYWDSSDEVIAQIEALNAPDELWLNDKFYGKVKDSKLTEAQTIQLIKHAKKNSKIVFKIGDYHWQISDKGMAAVLLKLDEVQGRVGTSLALVSKDNLDRQVPKVAKAKPVIKKAFAYAEQDNQQLSASKLAYFQKNIHQWVDINDPFLIGSDDNMGECELVNPNTEAYKYISAYHADAIGWEFTPIDATHTLASHLCWRAAYNEGFGYWLINHDKSSGLQLITTMGSAYYDGGIIASHKGIGLGGCWSMTEWVWNGETFIKALEQTTGLCRMIEAGGAWSMPTYTSDVVASK